MVPGVIGIYEQHELPGKIWKVIDDYASTNGPSNATETHLQAIHCPHCGVMNNQDAQFCSACGSPLTPTATPAPTTTGQTSV